MTGDWGLGNRKIIPNSQCPMPNAQCPMPNAQCPIPNPYDDPENSNC
ncbi:MAG: hypothetical protein V7K98_09725 [Nostoc sp.]